MEERVHFLLSAVVLLTFLLYIACKQCCIFNDSYWLCYQTICFWQCYHIILSFAGILNINYWFSMNYWFTTLWSLFSSQLLIDIWTDYSVSSLSNQLINICHCVVEVRHCKFPLTWENILGQTCRVFVLFFSWMSENISDNFLVWKKFCIILFLFEVCEHFFKCVAKVLAIGTLDSICKCAPLLFLPPNC